MPDKNLIDKFYKGECTDAEVKQVLDYFDNRQEGENFIENLWNTNEFGETSTPQYAHNMLEAIHQRAGISEQQAQYHILRAQWFRVAAILVFAFMLPWLLIDREPLSANFADAKQYITQENPAGHKSVVRLPDGSVVNLNAASSITYLEGFEDSVRKVVLRGEAFFDVAEDKSKPFIVSAAGVDTRALGTAFNVKAYEDDPHVQVVLASGSVKVSQPDLQDSAGVLLSPGEEAWVDKQTKAMRKQPADLYAALAWKDKLMVFNQASARQVFATLQRWYGVEISVSEELSDEVWHFNGEFQDEKLENVLLSISYVKNFKYQINHKSITITP